MEPALEEGAATVPPADAGEWLGLDLFDDEDWPPVAPHSEFCEFCATAADAEPEPPALDAEVEDAVAALLASCDEAVPFISFDLTISCLASLVLVPGLVRLIFILRPLSTVAECSTAILPGLPALPWTAFTPLTMPVGCLLPATVGVPFALPAPLVPAPFAPPLPLPGLLERADELTPQEDDDDDEDDEDDDERDDEEEEDDDDWLPVLVPLPLAEFCNW